MYLYDSLGARFWWLGVIAVAMLSAILFFQAVYQTSIDTPIRGDARDYVGYAVNLKTHGIYSRQWPNTPAGLPTPDALRAPGYPLLLSFFVDTTNNTIAIDKVLLLQALLGVLTLIIYLQLFRQFMTSGWALAAGLITAISPHLINASVYLLSESLFTFLLASHLLTLERAIRLKHIYWSLLAGTLLAISFLVRPSTQYLILVYLAFGGFSVAVRQHWKCVGLFASASSTGYSRMDDTKPD